jgi:ethanolamine utilization protein EutA
VGAAPRGDEIERLCTRLAEIMAEAIGLAPASDDLALFTTAHPLRHHWEYSGLTCSGGVADFVYNTPYDRANPWPYGDIGAVLGDAVKRCPALAKTPRLTPKETIRATVVGAGSNAVEISGSTIAWNDQSVLPLQNIPIVKMTVDDEAEHYAHFAERMREKIAWYKDEGGGYQMIALSFTGKHDPSFDLIKTIAREIREGLDDYLASGHVIVIVIEHDMAKALGYTLMNMLPANKFIVLDSLKVDAGDYIDIGLPVAEGRVIPVVIKTLVFGK